MMRKRVWGALLIALSGCSSDEGASDRPSDEGASDKGAEMRFDGAVPDASIDARSTAPTGDASTQADARAEQATDDCKLGTAKIDVRKVTVRKVGGGAATKGAGIELELELSNGGDGAMVELTPELDSERFSDYDGVPLATTSALVCPGESRVTISGGPFLSKGKKQYALGSGKYTVSALVIDDQRDEDFEGASFEVATSKALLVPVVYDEGYLTGIQKNPHQTPEEYLTASFTRPNEIFTPRGSDPDGAGDFQSFPKGFDEMMNVEHHFKSFPGFPGEDYTNEGWCEDATAYATEVLGLASKWASAPQSTRPDRHGFDYLIALTPDMGGGVACGWIDVQVSGFINRDLDRQQLIAVHESGHIFGAPHCDDVGNGSGGSLQGYVMCSGEKHAHYPDNFVWHKTSIDKMKSRWN